MCCVCEYYNGVILVIDVIWRRLCVMYNLMKGDLLVCFIIASGG